MLRILCIPYVDHVANATVRLRAGSPLQLSQPIQRSWLWLFGHVARMDASLDISRALKMSIRGLPIEWKRPPGRPRHTWLRTLEADLQPHNLGLNSAWKYAQDQEHWKHLVETAMLQLGACAWWWSCKVICECHGMCRVAVVQVYAATTDSSEEDILRTCGRSFKGIAKEGCEANYWRLECRSGYGQWRLWGCNGQIWLWKIKGIATGRGRMQHQIPAKGAPEVDLVGKHKNMIDPVLIDKKWKTAVRNWCTHQGADLSSILSCARYS